MPEPYAIVEVMPEWRMGREDLGSKTKFWYRFERRGRAWLFKYPNAGTGEHWAEKIAAELAAALGIEHARVELARFGGERGSATESFVGARGELYHGNQALAQALPDYDRDRKFGQSQHTLENIWRTFDAVFDPQAALAAKRRFAGYVVLDALIGNTDRHHENWGLLRRSAMGGWEGVLAPSFDHAAALGRELRDERREKIMAEGRVAQYLAKGRGGVYRAEDERRGPAPLALALWAIGRYPEFFRPAFDKLAALNENAIGDIVGRAPAGWMTPAARAFAIAVAAHGLDRLREAAP